MSEIKAYVAPKIKSSLFKITKRVSVSYVNEMEGEMVKKMNLNDFSEKLDKIEKKYIKKNKIKYKFWNILKDKEYLANTNDNQDFVYIDGQRVAINRNKYNENKTQEHKELKHVSSTEDIEFINNKDIAQKKVKTQTNIIDPNISRLINNSSFINNYKKIGSPNRPMSVKHSSYHELENNLSKDIVNFPNDLENSVCDTSHSSICNIKMRNFDKKTLNFKKNVHKSPIKGLKDI